ncbi:MAG: acetyl-coenzyme A synthetase N-terminal domain-containing protein, partial [Ilumatobacteraceae bacterium]
MSENNDTIDALSNENRTFAPPPEFVAGSHVSDGSLHAEAAADLEAFWARQATELVTWQEPWHTTLEWDLPYAKWFVGGKLNVAENCLDRHVAAGFGSKVAIHWEGEPGDTRTITYGELLDEVQRFANALRGLGVGKG